MYPERSSLSIRLTEPVVALRSTLERISRRHRDDEVLAPAVVRGLLVLKLAKPTNISSIELELQAKATTHFTQGAGPRRIDVTEQYQAHSASMVLFKTGPVSQERRRATSTSPRAQFREDHTGFSAQRGIRPRSVGGHGELWQALPGPATRTASFDPLVRRRFSSEFENGDSQSQYPVDPVPPYPSATNFHSHSFLTVDPNWVGRSQSVASTSEFTESRSSPAPSPGLQTPDTAHGSPEFRTHSIPDVTLSRTPSIEEVPEDENEGLEALGPDSVAFYGLSRITRGPSGRSSERDTRGRSRSHFSFGSVANVFEAMKDRVRSRSPQAGSRPRSDDQERGRSLTKGKGRAQDGSHDVHTLPQIGVAEPSVADGADDHNGAVFPEGTYTYPVFFTIPNDSPPTLKAEYGSLIWKVKAEVKRLGVFKSKITAQKEVVVIGAPTDNGSEEAEGIDLQQQWEGQLQYRVQIAGRGAPIGGKMPFQLTITPMAKVKIHSIFAYLDERTEYYTRTQSRARSDVIRRTTLMSIKHSHSDPWFSKPILPLMSDEPDAFRKSPLHHFLRPGEDESEVASSFMGPGPWTIHHDMSVPDSCSILHPSNRIKRSNVMVGHTLRLALRVEREQGTATTGRKKLYDIVIHVPIQILSCYCTSEWTSLPRYDDVLRSGGNSPSDISTCPCRSRRREKAHTHSHTAETRTPPLERDTSPPTATSHSQEALNGSPLDSLAGRTHLHEQLMSGLLSERGEAPPSYERSGDINL